MRIGILSVKNHRYHPNRRLMEAARTLNHEAILVHPGRLFMGVDDQGLNIGHLRRDFQADVILTRLGATIKEYGLTMIRHLELLGIPVINNYRSFTLNIAHYMGSFCIIETSTPFMHNNQWEVQPFRITSSHSSATNVWTDYSNVFESWLLKIFRQQGYGAQRINRDVKKALCSTIVDINVNDSRGAECFN